jgi:hypothetical protein
MRAVAQKFGDQFAVERRVVWAPRGRSAAMARTVGEDQLPPALGEASLGREVPVPAILAALGTAMDHHHAWSRIAPHREVHDRIAQHPLASAAILDGSRKLVYYFYYLMSPLDVKSLVEARSE